MAPTYNGYIYYADSILNCDRIFLSNVKLYGMYDLDKKIRNTISEGTGFYHAYELVGVNVRHCFPRYLFSHPPCFHEGKGELRKQCPDRVL